MSDPEEKVSLGPNNRIKVGHVLAALGVTVPVIGGLFAYMGTVRSDLTNLVAELQSSRETQAKDAAELRHSQEASSDRMEKQLDRINVSIKELDTNKVRLEPFLLWVQALRDKYPDTPQFIGR